MPSIEQILAGLSEIVNKWQIVAIFWHLYFGVLAIFLITRIRMAKRWAGVMLSLPLLSVSAIAWMSSNPFNGMIFAVTGLLLIIFSRRLPDKNVTFAPLWLVAPGIILAAFGWVYPHFLIAASWLSYLYESPAGLIPCATLSIVIGFALILKGFDSKGFSLTLGIVGLYYGITGVLQLGVMIDAVLLIGAILLVVQAFIFTKDVSLQDADPAPPKMTVMGVGPQIALISAAYFVFAIIVHTRYHEQVLFTPERHLIFYIAGAVFVLAGLALWASGAGIIIKAFQEGKLLTKGGFSIVRHPIYSGFILFLFPGIALLTRSWALLSATIVAYFAFRIVIRKEDDYLERKFGQEYLDYKSKVNAIFPFLRIK